MLKYLLSKAVAYAINALTCSFLIFIFIGLPVGLVMWILGERPLAADLFNFALIISIIFWTILFIQDFRYGQQ
jgi:hypothetical protein